LADAFKNSHGDVQVKHREIAISKPLETPLKDSDKEASNANKGR
jgi:hypothetical protein